MDSHFILVGWALCSVGLYPQGSLLVLLRTRADARDRTELGLVTQAPYLLDSLVKNSNPDHEGSTFMTSTVQSLYSSLGISLGFQLGNFMETQLITLCKHPVPT